MKEYICKEDLINNINKGLNISKMGTAAIEIMAEIEHMPAADVVEVVHGKWIPRNKSLLGSDYHCSICGNIANESNSGHYDRLTHYCSNCGARMDKEN